MAKETFVSVWTPSSGRRGGGGPIAIKGEDPSIMGKALKYIIIDNFFITNKQIGQKKKNISINIKKYSNVLNIHRLSYVD
jgi:hypothetical protein